MIELSNISSPKIRQVKNGVRQSDDCPDQICSILSAEDSIQAREEICQWQAYQPTRLHSLPGLAGQLNVEQILYKDEGTRLGLGSFKALGGAYGVLRFLQAHLSSAIGERISLESIRSGDHAEDASRITVVTATDGNHGRSVAWGAKQFGCQCRIYIHSGVSEGRQRAMEALGATVIRIDGNYDASVHIAAREADENNWYIVSDTSYEGYTEIPRYVMAGYTVMASEIVAALTNRPLPTHVFLQGGVGGLAGALCAFFWQSYGEKRPKVVVVEPETAPCLMASALAGQAAVVEVKEESIMAGLSCGEVSLLSWEILAQGADHFLSIPDDLVPDMMRILAAGQGGDPGIVAGESAVAGLAGLFSARRDTEISAAMGLDSTSRVLLIGTEGATDPAIYEAILAS
jgi:diaminopropionate ammonia-lyase